LSSCAANCAASDLGIHAHREKPRRELSPGPVTNELKIIRLNIDSYRRMLQIEVDETAAGDQKYTGKVGSQARIAKAAALLIHVNDRSSADRYF
jgi:hypothetical protein